MTKHDMRKHAEIPHKQSLSSTPRIDWQRQIIGIMQKYIFPQIIQARLTHLATSNDAIYSHDSTQKNTPPPSLMLEEQIQMVFFIYNNQILLMITELH
jgi:hypothetical protein